MTGCGSAWLERLVWDQEVAGSNPVTPILTSMREWLSWWSATLPRSRPRVRVPSRALIKLYIADVFRIGNTKTCASGSVGGARPCQGRGRGFESRLALL